MAIRGPGGPRPDPAATQGAQRTDQASPLQKLVDFGMAKTPQEAVKVLREIIALLGAAGFPVSKTGSPEQQMQSALRSFQKEQGLPVTGKLDADTAKALQDQGLLPSSKDTVVADAGARAGAKDTVDSAPRPGFDLGGPRAGATDGAQSPASSVPTQKGKTIETEQAAARSAQMRPDVEVDLKSMLNTMRAAGFAGAGKGREQLQDAVKKLQRVDGLPTTGKIDAKTAEALERRGVLDAATAQALKEQDPAWTPPTQSSADAAPTDARAREADTAAGAGGDASGKSEGRGDVGGDGTGTDGTDGRVDHGDAFGESDGFGNNYTGDDKDDDERRGLANRDDEPETFEHWEVPGIAHQIEAAFDAIVRDNAVGAATYGWTLQLHRPGIYAARQPAEEILKLVVSEAGPFDPVWQQALEALNDRLRRFDREADPVGRARLTLALQRARYRQSGD